MTIVVYTDGACQGNPGPGGWAWAVPGGGFASGAAAHTTNQRMEIQAALEAVRAHAEHGGPIEVVSDSTYVVNCFRDRWWEGWIAKGWINSQRKPVANRDLWEPLVELVQARGQVSFRWVKGHSGDVMNDLVDRLAVEAASRQQGRSGGGIPDEVGQPDEPRRRPAASRAVVADGGPPDVRSAEAGEAEVDDDPWQHGDTLLGGWPVAVLGHRPDELGVPSADGEDHPLLEALRDHLAEVLAELAVEHDDLVVVTGLRLGTEMAAAEAADEVGLPYVVVLPYPDPASAWAPATQARFARLQGGAERVVVLSGEDPGPGGGRTAALRRRDAWLVRWAEAAVVVWDGRQEGLGALVRSFRDRIDDAVVVLDPADLVGGRG